MLRELREEVLAANLQLPKLGLVSYTWGNVSGICRKRGLVAIMPSGVSYTDMKADDIVIVDLQGEVAYGELRPSSDTATHLSLYNAWPNVGGIVHTHSTYATMWAQARRAIPCFGTTHADYFYGEIPCTRPLSAAEIEGAYEKETGHVILEAFRDRDPMDMPAVLVGQHGPFTWGKDPADAVEKSAVLEQIALMALGTLALSPDTESVPQVLLDKHFLRKHGQGAYYGQG